MPQPDPSVGTDRIKLRGTPPNPRDPPSGCVFSTRCPSRIRPADGETHRRTVEPCRGVQERPHTAGCNILNEFAIPG
ncbi:MAG: hypothetical protein V5A55_04740 [Halovenus sp.]